LVVQNLQELLEWLQDVNWPVASPIANRLSKIGLPLAGPINTILSGADESWKYSILTLLCPKLSGDVILQVKPIIKRLALTPTPSEKLEELDVISDSLLGSWYVSV